jgi:hypothetical protein
VLAAEACQIVERFSPVRALVEGGQGLAHKTALVSHHAQASCLLHPGIPRLLVRAHLGAHGIGLRRLLQAIRRAVELGQQPTAVTLRFRL